MEIAASSPEMRSKETPTSDSGIYAASTSIMVPDDSHTADADRFTVGKCFICESVVHFSTSEMPRKYSRILKFPYKTTHCRLDARA